MSQKTYMYDTQWTALINAINGGDTSAIATALGQIKTSVDGITTALGNLSTDVTQDTTQWTNLINAISSGGGGGGGNVTIDSTQWSNLLTSIDKGDTSALSTALGLIKASVDSINTSLGSLSVGVSQNATQWGNLVNAITNQSLTVDLSNVTSSAVSNLSSVLGSTVTDALNSLLSTLVIKDKIYRFLLRGNVSAGDSFAYTNEYSFDNDIYIDGTDIKFRRSGIVRIFVHLTGSPISQASQKRVWARLYQGSTVVSTLIQYGEYTSQSTERIMTVNDSISVSITAVESILLNAGGIGPSYMEMQWIS